MTLLISKINLMFVERENSPSFEDDEDSEEQSENQCIISDISKKKDKKSIYGKGSESIAIKKELGDFDPFKSKSYAYIYKTYGRSIRFNELLGIINSLQLFFKYKKMKILPLLTRNEKRSFPLLIKYVEKNSELIIPYLQYISLCDSSFQKIPLDVK